MSYSLKDIENGYVEMGKINLEISESWFVAENESMKNLESNIGGVENE
jgi:hypothetical protein